MKCSLLTLSTFIDGELAPQRRAEVDAHLIGCTRCSAGAATLREEKARVGQLARVTVDTGSAQLMLEQVGIAVDPGVEIAPASPPPSSSLPDDDRRPWQRGASSAALPWTPRRPDRLPHGAAGDAIAPATVPSPDGQPELPLEGVRSVPPSWNRSAAASPPPPADVEEEVDPGEAGSTEPAGWTAPDEQPAGVPESWEADLPPPAEPAAHHVTSWSVSTPPAPAEPAAAPPPPPAAPALPLVAGPPTRVGTPSGLAALWARIHDAVSVRLALSRGGEALEDSAQIVSGAPPRRGEQLPSPQPGPAGIVAASPSWQAPPQKAHADLDRPRGDEAQAPVVAEPDAPSIPPSGKEMASPLHRASPAVGAPHHPDSAGGAEVWNAFAASSYPEPDVAAEPVAEEPRPRPQPVGRHSRAVARDQVPLGKRIGQVAATGVASLGARTGAVTARLRQAVGRAGKSGPDNRLLAGIAAIGLVFVVALIVGHGPSRPTKPAATRPASATSQPPAPHSAPATSTAPAAAATAAPVPTAVQTFGTGDTGFQVIRLRYGAQAHYMRVVFDMGAANGAAGAGGTPRVTVAFTTPTTLLVTFYGTLPAGSTGTPTAGNVISSVTLMSSSGNKTVYRFGLSRAATATAFYLASPTRFVLDIH